MNSWSKTSHARLATCHEELIIIFDAVLQIHDCTILCGHRNKADQNAAFASGASQKQWPDGNHNKLPSMAVDAQPYIPDIKLDGNNARHLKYFYCFAGIVIATATMLYNYGEIKHLLRWGGDWDSDRNMDDQNFNDLYHFELIEPPPS